MNALVRVMYDAVHTEVGSIPATAAMVAGYVSDHTPEQSILWTPDDWARFPAAIKVRISGDASIDADVLDMESGAAAYGDAPAWLKRNPRGTLYFSLDFWPDVRAALIAAGLDPALPPKWVADYNNVASLVDVAFIPGVVAKQFTDGVYDTSVVADYWPGLDPPPPTEGTHVIILDVADGGGQWLLSGRLLVQLQSPDTVASFLAAGVHQVSITAGELAALRNAAN